MKNLVKTCAMSLLLVGLSFPMLSQAQPAPASMPVKSMPSNMVLMKMHYQDAKGNMKETGVYVPAKKADELKKAKKVELNSWPPGVPNLL